MNNETAPSIEILFPPRLRWINVVFEVWRTLASYLMPAFVKQFLLRSSSEKRELFLIILQMTCTA